MGLHQQLRVGLHQQLRVSLYQQLRGGLHQQLRGGLHQQLRVTEDQPWNVSLYQKLRAVHTPLLSPDGCTFWTLLPRDLLKTVSEPAPWEWSALGGSSLGAYVGSRADRPLQGLGREGHGEQCGQQAQGSTCSLQRRDEHKPAPRRSSQRAVLYQEPGTSGQGGHQRRRRRAREGPGRWGRSEQGGKGFFITWGAGETGLAWGSLGSSNTTCQDRRGPF